MQSILTNVFAYLRGFGLYFRLDANGPIKSIGKTVIYNNNGTIHVGKHTCIWPDVKFSLTGNDHNRSPRLEIGEFSSIGDRSQIHCGDLVTIGSHVLISWDVNLLEYDYHAPGGGQAIPRPIVIEDEVWIGARCIITKGVTIGRGSIIGAGSVVVKDVPPYTLAAGNPARPIRQVDSWRGSSAYLHEVRQ